MAAKVVVGTTAVEATSVTLPVTSPAYSMPPTDAAENGKD